MMKVKCISHTIQPEKVCAIAALTSTGKKIMDLEEIDLEKARKLIRKIIDYGHYSVLEHASFTFKIENISRVCSHQLVRHRLASYTQQSQRYVTFSDEIPEIVIPESIKRDKELKEKFMRFAAKSHELYKAMLERGIKAEDSRYVLLNAFPTNIVVTMNARELLHFFELRLCERAQLEIRILAKKMLQEVKKIAPSIFEKAGPRCVRLGYCPEGELGCGKYPPKK